MLHTPASAIDALLSQGQLWEAARAIELQSCNDRDDAARRLAAGVYALSGREREMAVVCEPRLLGIRSQADGEAYLLATPDGPSTLDIVTVATVLTWSGEPSGAYACFERAHDRAVEEGRYHLAAGARERLAHHAHLFGDVLKAQRAIADALALASSHDLGAWRLRSAAAAADLALEQDNYEQARQLLSFARSVAAKPADLALFSPAGVRLSLVLGEDARATWAGPETLHAALYSDVREVAIAATMACILADGGTAVLDPPLSLALRRALMQATEPAASVEFHALVAHRGDPDDALCAVDALRAILAPRRRYIEAHYLLARAHVLLRSGDRGGAIDAAGDAARAFDSIGLRHWTNDAMLLLVQDDERSESRRRPTAVSLTRREQQVAHLVRRGASNREVARTLQISEHTVERHVSSILSRLGLRSRWQIVDVRNAGG